MACKLYLYFPVLNHVQSDIIYQMNKIKTDPLTLLHPSPKNSSNGAGMLGNKSQKISCSFQLLLSLSVNCENNKSNSLQMSDIRFLQVSVFFFSLGPFCVRNVMVRIYNGYSQLWVFQIWEHFCYVLKHFILFFLKIWAVKTCGLQICWYSKYVGIQKCG